MNEAVKYPDPDPIGVIKAFSTIMFAFAGASTFPTIQADMKHKDQFKWSAIIACTSKQLFLMKNIINYRFLTTETNFKALYIFRRF